MLGTCMMLAGLNAMAAGSIYHKGWIDFNKNGRKDVYEDTSRSTEERIEDLLAQMNTDEKTCQLATLYGYRRVLKDSLPTPQWKEEIWKDGIANIDEQLNGIRNGGHYLSELVYPFANHVEALNKIQRWFVEETRLGIPVEFTNEGIHGLNHAKATPLPAPIGIGSTWNRNLVRQAGEIAGREARLLGYHSVYAPILDPARDPRWGRTLECYGEDPWLIGELGVEMAGGIQSQGVAACLKHFAAYSVPKGGRDGDCRTDPHINPRDLHDIFLRPFKRVIEAAHPWEVMSSYNDWNGIPVSADPWFLTTLLRETYGFDGYVVSDSKAVEYVYTKHQVAETYEDAIRQVLEAGLNVRTQFTQPKDFILPLRRLLAEGRIDEKVVDQRVREVLRVKFRLGLFDTPYQQDMKSVEKEVGAERHEDFAMQMGMESMVLLKNEGGLLPLDASKLRKVLVTGPLAAEDNFMTSRYGPTSLECTTVLDGIRNYLKGKADVAYSKGCDIVDDNWPQSEIIEAPLTGKETRMMDEAVKAARDCDVVIAVVGEDDKRTGESRSRTSLDLPGRQHLLMKRLVEETGKPVVMVMVNGQPLTINWEDRYVPAILEAWFPHYRGGQCIASTLFGENNPSGKLTITFPRSIGQIEMNFPFKKGSHAGQPSYIDPNGNGNTRIPTCLYPFGYGLSYTTFRYSDMKVESDGKVTGDIRVSLTVSNTGQRAGKETVQLYVRDEYSSVVTYDSVLRGFEKVSLAPGEEKQVCFTLHPSDLAILDRNMNWTTEPGDFTIMVGSSSVDIRAKERVTLK